MASQLLYNDITEDTSYKLYNLTVCDIYTATVIAHSGGYNSSNTTAQDECNEGSSNTFTFLLKLMCLSFLQRVIFLYYWIIRPYIMVLIMIPLM